MFDVSAFLRFGTASLVLWAIEQGTDLRWDSVVMDDPVQGNLERVASLTSTTR